MAYLARKENPAPREDGRITADDLKRLLLEKHASDIATPEAVIGFAGGQRFDMWAMKPTWAETRCSGYEVKVSRSDFLNDNKWQNYLPFCTEFSFVCPPNLIQPGELPDGVGLLWSSSTGSRLYTKRKAAPREIEPANLNMMLIHVLMWRYRAVKSGRESAAEWLEDRSNGGKFDYEIKQKIRRMVGEECIAIRKENEELKIENKRLAEVRAILDGEIPNWREINIWDLKRGANNAFAAIPDSVSTLSQSLKYLSNNIENLQEELTKAQEAISAKLGKPSTD